MARCGYVSSESSKKYCRKCDAASRSGVRISTRSWVVATVMLSRFMYSIVSETMVNDSCGLCTGTSSARSFEGGCGDSSQWNLYCVNHIADAYMVDLITSPCKCYVASRIEALSIGEWR